MDEQRPQVIDPVRVVGVLMRDENAIDPVNVGIEKLHAQVRSAIHQHARAQVIAARAFDQQRTTPPSVLRVVRIAFAPAKRDARNTHGRAAAENGECEAHAALASWRGTLLNSRKKFSVVCRAISSADTPRTSAKTLAVSAT